ncbi:ImmA/IrrE family metallo-endopeptidase [Myxococcus sp. AM011]|uniref:ImmA/IrrE family metallo-endopeptidase n=1 Tax=Myxococcus sp. AM011 TaxID=2745200 RepID=UPI0015963883|nr:ImmA/IrrE family metallo-endopeptidase [Myxococcus sp. AM011]NVJ20597.1 ImmA/IrrE family metallo-endopeptidase [Myxococcus sp. AM011]
MTARWMEEAVEASGLTAPLRFPRDLVAEISQLLPVLVVALPNLTPQAVREWLLRRDIHIPVPRDTNDFHDFHGCMVADAGRGFVFHDSSEGRHEQRFTVAHELSHFILDQWMPRVRAVRVFGEAILPVLDGQREPTPEESLTALFEKISLGPTGELMARDASGHYARREVMESERRADLLALELLAPEALVIPLVKDVSEGEGTGRVVFRFGLTWEVAHAHVHALRCRLRVPRFSIEQFLGVEEG